MQPTLWQSFQHDNSGATMVEYGLLVALIALAAAAGASVFGIAVNAQLFVLAATLAASL